MKRLSQLWLPILLVCFTSAVVSAQTTPVEQGGGSFRVQCPRASVRHPDSIATSGTGTVVNPHPESADAPYAGLQVRTATKDPSGTQTFSPALTFVDNGGAIRCQEISGGDGMMTEAGGNQTFMFSFGPLSGLGAIQNGQPGTQFPVATPQNGREYWMAFSNKGRQVKAGSHVTVMIGTFWAEGLVVTDQSTFPPRESIRGEGGPEVRRAFRPLRGPKQG